MRKKLEHKAFARTVDRDDVDPGAEGLGADLDAHLGFVVQALSAAALGLG